MASLKRALAPPTAQRKAARTEATRMALFEAAGRVIGRYGYEGCSIARVTTKAKIAHGTFYLYFSSQQELFSQIRVALGTKMLDEVFKSVGPATCVRDYEAQYIRASMAYFKKYPFMYKVIATPEQPGARRNIDHMRLQVDRYLEGLRTIMGPAYTDDYLKALTVMIMGVRSNILQTYGLRANVMFPPPDDVIEFYLNFIAAGAASPANLASPQWTLGGVPSNLDAPPATETGRVTASSPGGGVARRKAVAGS